MLYWTQEAQSQILSENGVREIVVGVIGEVEERKIEVEPVPINELSKIGVGKRVKPAQLPDDVYWTLQAENHRIATGESIPTEDYKKKYGSAGKK